VNIHEYGNTQEQVLIRSSPALQIVASREHLVKQYLTCLIIDAHHLHNDSL